MRAIEFLEVPSAYQLAGAYVAHLSQVSGRLDLFNQLATELNFPDYFGSNWDALLDLLCDFHWIEQREVILIHDGGLILEESDLKNYIDILCEAVESSQAQIFGESKIFNVIFSKDTKKLIQRYLR